MIVLCFDPSKGGLSAAEFAAKNYLTTLVSILEQDEPHALKLVKYDLQPWTESLVGGCCLATTHHYAALSGECNKKKMHNKLHIEQISLDYLFRFLCDTKHTAGCQGFK